MPATANVTPSTPEQNIAAKKVPAAGSDYVILEASPADSAWKERGTIRARSVEHAIRQHVERNAQDGGQFIAVPARSWTPVTVTVEQTTRIRLT